MRATRPRYAASRSRWPCYDTTILRGDGQRGCALGRSRELVVALSMQWVAQWPGGRRESIRGCIAAHYPVRGTDPTTRVAEGIRRRALFQAVN